MRWSVRAKLQIVKDYLNGTGNATQHIQLIERAHNITPIELDNWVQSFLKGGLEALRGSRR